jgi:uncharacterized membrane protein
MKPFFDLNELVSANVITPETALKISDYYKKKELNPIGTKNRQLLLFGIVGALLVGIGLMFIIANQWERLPKMVKTTCAFLVLIIPQLLCLYVLLKQPGKVVWKESTALLLFFAVGASISLVSQIYHINGEPSGFMLTWMLLTAPLIYILDSSAVSLAYLFGIMSYCITVKFDAPTPLNQMICWLLFTVPLPRYFLMLRRSPNQPLLILHHWVIPFVLTIAIGTLMHHHGELMPPVYFSLFGVFYLWGNFLDSGKGMQIQNGFRIFGFAGTIVMLMVMSFRSSWEKLLTNHYELSTLVRFPEFIALVILMTLALLLLYNLLKTRTFVDLKAMEVTWACFLLFFVLGLFTKFPVYLINLYVLVAAILMIREGSLRSHLGVLNVGLIIIALLVVCRSFDADLTFVVKGTLFVLVGIGFFVANWLMLKKRKEHEA